MQLVCKFEMIYKWRPEQGSTRVTVASVSEKKDISGCVSSEMVSDLTQGWGRRGTPVCLTPVSSTRLKIAVVVLFLDRQDF